MTEQTVHTCGYLLSIECTKARIEVNYRGSISDFTSVEIQSGVVSFFGASTYTGTTTISGGTLIAANITGSATGSGPVAVTGGTLGGTGSIGGSVTIGGGSGSAAPAPAAHA